MHNFQTPNPHPASEPPMAAEPNGSRGHPFFFTLDEAIEAQRLHRRNFGSGWGSSDGRMMRVLTPIAVLILVVPFLLSILPGVLALPPIAVGLVWTGLLLKQEFLGIGGAAISGDLNISDNSLILWFEENGVRTTQTLHPNPSMRWMATEAVTVVDNGPQGGLFVAHHHLPDHLSLQLHQLLATRIGSPTPVKPENGGALAEVGKFLLALIALAALIFVSVSLLQ